MLSIGKWFLIFGFLLITGCGMISVTQPLSDPLTAEPDETLYGHWLNRSEAKETHVFIGKHRLTSGELPESIMEFTMTMWDADDNRVIVVTSGYFTVTHIGKYSYINFLQRKKEADKIRDYSFTDLSDTWYYEDWTKNKNKVVFILRYSNEDKKIQVWFTDQDKDFVKILVNAGKLKLVDGVVTADSLVRYLRKNGGEELFNSKPSFFTKVP